MKIKICVIMTFLILPYICFAKAPHPDETTVISSVHKCYTGTIIVADDGQSIEVQGCPAERVVYTFGMPGNADDEVQAVGKNIISQKNTTPSLLIKIGKDGKFPLPGSFTKAGISAHITLKDGAPQVHFVRSGEVALEYLLFPVYRLIDDVTVNRNPMYFMAADPKVTEVQERMTGTYIEGRVFSLKSRKAQQEELIVIIPLQ